MVNLHCGVDLCTANHFLGLFCLWCIFVSMCVVVLVHIHICCFGSAQEPALGLEPPEGLMGKDPISMNRVCLGFFFFLEEILHRGKFRHFSNQRVSHQFHTIPCTAHNESFGTFLQCSSDFLLRFASSRTDSFVEH